MNLLSAYLPEIKRVICEKKSDPLISQRYIRFCVGKLMNMKKFYLFSGILVPYIEDITRVVISYENQTSLRV